MFQARYVRYPQLELTQVTRDVCKFVLRNCDVSFANALRRIMIAEVPTLAIDLVSIEENSGVLQDEMIAHRLGLLPIDSTDIQRFVNKSECKCSDSCGKCAAKYTLDVQCPSDSQYTVTHFDIMPHAQSPPLYPRIDQVQQLIQETQAAIMAKAQLQGGAGGVQSPPIKLKETDFGHLLTKLTKNQAIKAELLAIKGIGKIHTKWSPCATATFKYQPVITINQQMQSSVPSSVKKAIVENSAKGLFRLIPIRNTTEDTKDGDFYLFGPDGGAGGDEEYNIAVDDPTKCLFNTDCEEVLKAHGIRDFITISHVPDLFMFEVESTGAMPALQIVRMGLEVMIEKLEHINERFASLPQVSQIVQGFGKGLATAMPTALDLS